MHRKRMAIKEKWGVTFMDLPSAVMSKLLKAYYSSGDYVKVTAVDALTNKILTKTYYSSSITKGAQVYRAGDIWYKGATFNATER